MQIILPFILLAIGAVYMIKIKNSHTSGGLLRNEKITVWVLTLLAPFFVGPIFYFGWRNALPKRSKEALGIFGWSILINFATLGAFGLYFRYIMN